jgi:pimeloyl-ACP methyl ester carboxylesterase
VKRRADSMGEITSHSIRTPRLTIAYRRHGDDDGLPMLLLHGGLATSRWWEPFMTVLPPEICSVAPDLRGCGLSDKSERGYSIEEMAADLDALLDALSWNEVDLVGHAVGGAIAVEYTLTHQQRVRTLSLVAPAPIEGVYTPIDTLMLLEQMRTDRPLLVQALGAVMPAFDANAGEHAHFFSQLVDDAASLAPPVYSGMATALNNWNRFADARRLTLPTLLVWGDQDIIVDRDAMTRTLIAIPGANNLEVLRDVGHAPMLEAPVALAERLIEFITEDFDDYDQTRALAT